MLTDETKDLPIKGLTCTDAIVVLQVINRLTANGGVKDEELSVIGNTRDRLVATLEEASGLNFDVERNKRLQQLREQQQLENNKPQAANDSSAQ